MKFVIFNVLFCKYKLERFRLALFETFCDNGSLTMRRRIYTVLGGFCLDDIKRVLIGRPNQNFSRSLNCK